MEVISLWHPTAIDFGIIYFGNWNARTDGEELTAAGERVKAYELVASGRPDHVLF